MLTLLVNLLNRYLALPMNLQILKMKIRLKSGKSIGDIGIKRIAF